MRTPWLVGAFVCLAHSAAAAGAVQLPALSINDVTAVEGNTGTTSMTFTVTLSAASGQVVTVQYVTTRTGPTIQGPTCAPTVDLLLSQGTLAFSTGVPTQSVTVTVCGDALDETDETFDVVLSNPTGATLADGTGRGMITDDDLPPQPGARVDDTSFDEGTGTGRAPRTFVTVRLPAPSSQAVTVTLTTFSVGSANGNVVSCSFNEPRPPGTPRVPPDYVTSSSSVQFPPGDTAEQVPITICRDAEFETNERFGVRVTGPFPQSPPDEAIVTIRNDDPIPGQLPPRN